MPPQNQPQNQPRQEESSNAGMIILIILLLIALAMGAGYYYYYVKNRPNAATLPYQQQPEPSYQEPEPVTPVETAAPTDTLPLPPTTIPTSSASQTASWKTYTYRAPGGGGFSIKYPPGYAVGQERTKDETYFTIYKSPNPLNEDPAMEINYESNGDVRFSQGSNGDWEYYDLVVQSFQKIK